MGFGSLVLNSLYRPRERVGEDNRVAEYLLYAVFVTGILVSLTSKSAWQLSQSWLSVAMLLYLVEIGLLHGVLHRAERDYRALLIRVNTPAAAPPADDETRQLYQLEQRIRLGWGAFDVIFLVVLYLMVFTPGHVRVG